MENKSPQKYEPEWTGSWWKHPYVLYIVLVTALFLGLILAGYLALQNGWIPNRGNS